MARIVISFKEKSKEEMELYNEFLKRSCGDNSAYGKMLLREKFGMDSYKVVNEPTKKKEEPTSNKEEPTSNEHEHEEEEVKYNNQDTYSDNEKEDDGDIELEMPEIPEEYINKASKPKEVVKEQTQSTTQGNVDVSDIAMFLNNGSIPIVK